jgi:hypothetical protein
VCVAVITFWPYAAGYNDTFLEISPLRQSLVSIENTISSSITIALAVPLLIDTLMDGVAEMFQAKQSIKRSKFNNKEFNVVNILERLLLCFGFIVSPANALHALHSNDHNTALFAFCWLRARLLIVLGAVVLSFSRNQNNIMSTRLSALLVGLLSASMVIVGYTTLEGQTGSRLHVFGASLQYIVLILFYGRTIWFLVRGYYKWRRLTSVTNLKTSTSVDRPAASTVAHLGGIYFQGKDDDNSSNGSKDGAGLYFSLTWCATVMVGTMIMTFIAISITRSTSRGKTHADSTPYDLALQNIAYSVSEIGLLVFHLRQVKFAAVTRLVRVINEHCMGSLCMG